MKLYRTFLIVLIVTILGHLSSNSIFAAPVYPLKKSANNRYLVDQNNIPVLINGDAPWEILNNVSREDIDFLLQKRSSQGVNTVIFSSPEIFYVPVQGQNYYGDLCFDNLYDLSQPNEAYFAHTDYAINKAAEYGIQVMLSIYYEGCCGDGWYNYLADPQTTEAETRAYGTWIGNRYKNFPNLIYTLGGDKNPNSTSRPKLKAMAEGLSAADSNHLITFHTYNNNQARLEWNPNTYPWLTLNNTYVYDGDSVTNDPYTYALNAFNATPILPFILFESKYEGEGNAPPPATTQSLREVAYQTILGGGAGHVYGNRPVWNAGPGWKQALDAPGATELLPNIKKLFESRAWYQLIPDQNHSIVTSGYANPAGIVPNALTADGTTLIAYIPNSRSITVDLTKIASPTTKAWWFNPRNGTAQLIGTYPDANQPFTSPDNNDWVLVLDDASKNLPPPGDNLSPSPTASPSPLPVTGDLDGDGDVDLLDLLKLVGIFGSSSPSFGDLNSNGRIDIFDMNVLIQNL